MREAKIVVDMIQGELLPHAVCALAERADPSSDRGHMLADGQVEALHERRVDLPATGRKHLLDRLKRAEHDAVADADQTPPAYGLDDLRIEQLRQGHPAGRGRGTFGLATRELYPLPVVGEQRGQIVFEPIGEKQRNTAWR